LIDRESHFAIERNSTDIRKQNSTLDGNPAITTTYSFVNDDPVYEYVIDLEKELAEQDGKTYIPEDGIDNIEVYERKVIISVKDGISYLVMYTAPKLEFNNYY
jgi:hypothetical protein